MIRKFLASILILGFITGGVFMGIDMNSNEGFYKEGSYKFTYIEWKEFKDAVYQNNIPFSSINYIDSNEPVLVKFKILDKANTFNYGNYIPANVFMMFANCLLAIITTIAVIFLFVIAPFFIIFK